MSGPCEDAVDQLCGCCAGTGAETPEVITNRPALPAIAYRVGRHGTFNASMLASLSSSDFAPMALLRTREASDFSIALLDAWAVSLDILTFYQERFANEAFLRTAVDQRSVFELARLVGYVPSPGVAASAVLAFTLYSAQGSPDNVTIAAGSRVQSVPGPGQTAQVFETQSDITARIAYNALPAQTSIPWQLSGNEQDTSTWVQGTATKVNVGDALLFLTASSGEPKGTGPGDVHYVTSVEPNATWNATKITWDGPLSSAFASGQTASDVCIFVFRKKAALYGAQAPNAAALPWSVVQYVGGHPAAQAEDWVFAQYGNGANQVNLDASYPGLQPPARGSAWVVLTGLTYTSYFQITGVDESNPNLYTLTAKTTRLTLAKGRILAGDKALSLDDVLWHFVAETRDITAYVQSEQLVPADLPLTTWSGPYPLQADMPAPVAGGSLTVEGGQQLVAGQPVGISGKRARMLVRSSAGATFTPASSSASIPVLHDQTFLVDAYPPVNGGLSVITLSGVLGTLAVGDGGMELLPADKADPTRSEAAWISTVSVAGDFTTLGLRAPLARIYDASTVAVNANAVNATNGETVQEILGSGDGTNAGLQLALKQAPLTYVTSSAGNGAQSTLQVWINNLRWHEVPNLLASGPADRVFVTRVNPNGNVVVRFGDGAQGARTPTGQANVRAVYRKGIGSAGMVNAGQVTQPLDRPQGLSSVTNPSPASGAADPASADDARASAPLPTLTLGRVVSLEDYQNYALAFAGIARAVASWAHFSGTRGVFLTVAGEGGATLSANDPILANLIAALRAIGNPYVPLHVVSYQPVLFRIAGVIKVDQSTYDTKQVLLRVWQNLVAAFSFEERMLGQNVAASEVVEVIQATPGVVALQLQALFASGSPSSAVPAALCAAGALPPKGAGMLILDPASQGSLGAWS